MKDGFIVSHYLPLPHVTFIHILKLLIMVTFWIGRKDKEEWDGCLLKPNIKHVLKQMKEDVFPKSKSRNPGSKLQPPNVYTFPNSNIVFFQFSQAKANPDLEVNILSRGASTREPPHKWLDMATHLSAAKGQHSHRASFRGRAPVCGIRGSVLHVAALRLRVVVHSIEGLASNRRLLSSVERVIRNGRKREAPQRGQANSCAFRGSWEILWVAKATDTRKDKPCLMHWLWNAACRMPPAGKSGKQGFSKLIIYLWKGKSAPNAACANLKISLCIPLIVAQKEEAVAPN